MQRVLVVDDNPLNVEILEILLCDEYTVATAASGVEALELVASFRPDVVLLDVMMPGMDGYEVCRELRARPETAGCYIVMVSAKPRTELETKGIEAGADDYVTKPFDPDDMIHKVRACFRALEQRCEAPPAERCDPRSGP